MANKTNILHLGSLYWDESKIKEKTIKVTHSDFYNTKSFVCFPFNKPISKIISLNDAQLEKK